MSRNIGQTSCDQCPAPHDKILLEEEPRPVSKDDTGEYYYSQYLGLTVANAKCSWCHTLYLAWVHWEGNHEYWNLERRPGERFADLSYRNAFNDEPSPKDLPLFEIETVVKYVRRRRTSHPYLYSDKEHDVFLARQKDADMTPVEGVQDVPDEKSQ